MPPALNGAEVMKGTKTSCLPIPLTRAKPKVRVSPSPTFFAELYRTMERPSISALRGRPRKRQNAHRKPSRPVFETPALGTGEFQRNGPRKRGAFPNPDYSRVASPSSIHRAIGGSQDQFYVGYAVSGDAVLERKKTRGTNGGNGRVALEAMINSEFCI